MKEAPKNILLVNPPLASPIAPPRGLARAARALAGLGLKLQLWDANLELWQTALLPGAAEAAQVLRSGAFYQPETYLTAWERVRRAGERFEAESWREAAAGGLGQSLPPGPALLVINLEHPEQWPCAVMLAEIAKDLEPQTTVALLGSCLVSRGGPGGGPWDHLLAGPEGLCRLLGHEPPTEAAPDFSGLALDEYLSPKPATELGPLFSPADPPGPGELAGLVNAGVDLLRWRLPEGDNVAPDGLLKGFRRSLKAAAAAGLWSHLHLPAEGPWREGLLHMAGVNPHLVHSWSPPRPWPWQPGFGQDLAQPHGGGYDELTPMPGRPLWRALSGVEHLVLYLRHHGLERMRRWWLPPAGPPYQLGSEVSYHYHRPDDLPAQRLEQIARLILAAGKVGSKWLRHNLEKAYMVGWAQERGVMVGTDTLKRPRQEYLDAIHEQSGYDLSGYAERGYISILPQYRGLGVGSQLIQRLVARAGDLQMFVIVGRENKGGEQILRRNQTRLVATYYSRKLDKEMGIWMPVDQEPPQPTPKKAQIP